MLDYINSAADETATISTENTVSVAEEKNGIEIIIEKIDDLDRKLSEMAERNKKLEDMVVRIGKMVVDTNNRILYREFGDDAPQQTSEYITDGVFKW